VRARLLRKLTLRKSLVALVLLTAALGSTIVYADAAKVTTTYRTAVVSYGTITQTIGMAGNLAPVSEADLNFASSGTVASVDVQVGQKVPAGTMLAALDATLLSAQLLQAQATLSSAEAKLTQDKTGTTAQSLASAQNAVGAAQVAVNNAQASMTDTQAINAQAVASAQAPVTAAQSSLTGDQTAVNQDQTVLTADQATMATACVSPSTACDTAKAAVTADQAKVAADQAKLTVDQATLAAAKSSLATTTVKAQQSNDQAAAALATAQQQLASARSSLAAQQTGATTQTLQMDEAQIQIDQVNVSTAQHQLDGATLIAPIDGVVSQVNIKAGQAASGAGTSASAGSAIVIYSPGAYQVTGTVSDAQVNLVAIGQTAEVTPAGSTQALLGKITSIAPAATVSSGVATFGVTAQLTDTSNSIKPGMSATVNIVVNQVVHVLTVPTSAVHTTAAGSTVQILVNDKPQSVVVQTGASDPTRIQIISGLQLGQTVVIAVITSNVPSSGAGTVLGGGGTRGNGGGNFRGTGGG
jgi:multidrug efflux pump subunit AcrA (membrane-fusion protein)